MPESGEWASEEEQFERAKLSVQQRLHRIARELRTVQDEVLFTKFDRSGRCLDTMADLVNYVGETVVNWRYV